MGCGGEAALLAAEKGGCIPARPGEGGRVSFCHNTSPRDKALYTAAQNKDCQLAEKARTHLTVFNFTWLTTRQSYLFSFVLITALHFTPQLSADFWARPRSSAHRRNAEPEPKGAVSSAHLCVSTQHSPPCRACLLHMLWGQSRQGLAHLFPLFPLLLLFPNRYTLLPSFC